MIRLIFVGLLTVLCLAFFFKNQDQDVTLWYFFGIEKISTPISFPMLGAFAAGFLAVSLLLVPTWIRSRLELRRQTKALKEAEADLERLRRSLEDAQAGPGDLIQQHSFTPKPDE